MIHHGEGLPLLRKARDDLLRIHAELDDLQRHAPPHWCQLVCHPNRAKATSTDLLQQFVSADQVAGMLPGHTGDPVRNTAGWAIAEIILRRLVIDQLSVKAQTSSR